MSDIVLDVQSPPATPAAGQIILYGDTLTKKIKVRNDTGAESVLGGISQASVANQTGFAADTYMAGSNVAIPSALVRAGTIYRFLFDMVKTGAGVAAPTVIVRMGTLGTVVDAARLTFTFGIGTAAIDTGIVEVWAHFRNVGAAAVLTGMCRITHHLAATGLTTTGASGTAIILNTSAAFDSTVPASILGVSFNGGAAFAGTNTVQQATLDNL